ncbi:serine--tRNA ligase [Salmonella enterica]|nr:serine--tRNA ligase [Salmonella enterica subsp. enterica]EFT7222728.1 serine--tRNA ligase [Salmonella enterica]MBQ4989964.1 serine--tRNA ligase [Salmonella enterica subsp. diarizonae serovar 61:l,v:1,5,7]EIR8714428.1 serine--tRNA ligase [Salmonella enterica]MBQ4993950.1 serine--tRNA ligase [Salmonella enterica subsp. diarizonae serovar 61:l,v:1,5,7]
MIDMQELSARMDEMKRNVVSRGIQCNVDEIVLAYSKYKACTQKLDSLRASMNQLSRKIGTDGSLDREAIQQASALKRSIVDLEPQEKIYRESFQTAMLTLPNWIPSDTPQGLSDNENVEIKRWGALPAIDNARDHLEIAQRLDLIDFESGTKVAGKKFYFLKNEAVMLDLALQAFALKIVQKHGFIPLQTPDLAKNSILEGIGFSPRGNESNIYRVESTDLSLIATAEITVGGMHSDETLALDKLPLKYVALSHCFRTEAGASGRTSKGLYRVHQFNKVEMFVFCAPEDSQRLHEEILQIEEEIYQLLNLPYRVLRICAGDLGAPASKKYDIEAWMPGKDGGEYGEVTSASNCTDFQARRLGIRYQNGTAIATSRVILAILENYQQPDGSVVIPQVLQDYMGLDSIKPR